MFCRDNIHIRQYLLEYFLPKFDMYCKNLSDLDKITVLEKLSFGVHGGLLSS